MGAPATDRFAEADVREWREAAEHLLLVATRYDDLDCPGEGARAREQAALALWQAGDGRAEGVLRAAMHTYESLGADRDAARCRRLARAHGVRIAVPHRQGRTGYGEMLSPREIEVARLVAAGYKNREIGVELYLSPATVDGHLGRAMRKLGVHSRAAVAAAPLWPPRCCGRATPGDNGQLQWVPRSGSCGVRETARMSPVSRGRKGRRSKRTNRRPSGQRDLPVVEVCDCPECSGADFDPELAMDGLLASAAELLAATDPLDVELFAATLMASGAPAGELFDEMLVDGLIPALEARTSTEALTTLLGIGAVAGGQVRKAAAAAADRLVDAGVARPRWAAELGEPETVTDCCQVIDAGGDGAMVGCVFNRAGRSHAVLVSVDYLDCGVADAIHLFDGERLPAALEVAEAKARALGLDVVRQELDAAELRWLIECALDARAVHDADDDLDVGMDDPGADGSAAEYAALAVLVRARMAELPLPSRPMPAHGDVGGRGLGLPARRGDADGRAPIYQLKVSLAGMKPPIWRRLEVPGDVTLAQLHTVIQMAFGWCDSHMHLFDTPFGAFGSDISLPPEESVTLEQVVPAAKDAIGYTYDFGDDWRHDIVVEKILDRDENVLYPRCTGGRRAAPPEDCGGVPGYAALLDALADPRHPQHIDKLNWLALTDAAEFDPTRFDAKELTSALEYLPLD